jgi:hypothetical protein
VSFWRKLFRGASGLPEPPPFVAAAFEPLNDLERALVAGEPAAVREALGSARVFVPSLQDASAMKEGDSFRPVMLEYDVGPCVVALSSSSRLSALLPAIPQVQSGIEVEAGWLLDHCPAGVGLALNPGWREGLVLRAEDVAGARR